MKIILNSLFWIWLIIFISSCSTPGSDAYRDYRSSYDAARSASGQVVSIYNEYEKVNRGTRIDDVTFNPDLADVYSATALSPVSAKITEGFGAATVYIEVLARYLDNNTIDLHSAEIARLNEASTSMATITGVEEIGAQLNAIVGATRSLVNLSLAKNDRSEFIRAVQVNSKIVDDFLGAVRADTVDMYRTARLATAISNGSTQKLQTFRVMLANWVLLIDQTRADLAALSSEVESASSAQTALKLLSESAERTVGYAREIDTAYTALSGVF